MTCLNAVRVVVLAGLIAWAALASADPGSVETGTGSHPAGLPPAPDSDITDVRLPPPNPAEVSIQEAAFSRFAGLDQKEVIACLREYLPDEMYEFRRLAQVDVPASVEYMTDLISKACDLIRVKDTDPEHFKKMLAAIALQKRAAVQARAGRAASGRQKERVLESLRATLAESFDVKQDMMARELEQMESELDSLRRLIDKRRQNRDAIIDRRLREMTGEASEPDW